MAASASNKLHEELDKCLSYDLPTAHIEMELALMEREASRDDEQEE